MKRFLLIFVLMTGFIAEAGAVLKEKDLEQTLAILQSELEQYNNELTMRSAVRRERAKQLITNLLLTMKQADQNALMLYSQEQTHPFDMTYACKEATKSIGSSTADRSPLRSSWTRTPRSWHAMTA